MPNTTNRHKSSFRDPSGHIEVRDGQLVRLVMPSYQKEYDLLFSSGLYKDLTERNLLVEHTEEKQTEPGVYKILKPTVVPCISYPYEWSFGQLKDAALATLRIQKTALEHDMSLKDASAYNIQFYAGRPVLIDTLSFEQYDEGSPWVAYRQFCQHFLAPLALMAKTDIRLSQLLRIYIDGIPLDLASRLLPSSSRFNLGLLSHIHLHAQAQKTHADSGQKPSRPLTKPVLLSLLQHLEDTISRLDLSSRLQTEWGKYYEATNYSDLSFKAKETFVGQAIDGLVPKRVVDLGANDGTFSRLSSKREIITLAADIDPLAVETNYRKAVADKDAFILPLLIDLTNPPGGIGWANEERESFFARAKSDLVLALALIHHLAISNNIPLSYLAETFANLGENLVVEFIPKSDSQVQRLLRTRVDVFNEYDQQHFEEAFGKYFSIKKQEKVAGSERTLYLMQRK